MFIKIVLIKSTEIRKTKQAFKYIETQNFLPYVNLIFFSEAHRLISTHVEFSNKLMSVSILKF